MTAQVAGKSLLEHLASLAFATDRLPQGDGALLLANGAGPQGGGQPDMAGPITPVSGDAAGQVQVLFAECLFFATWLREHVGQAEFASMLGVLDASTLGRNAHAVCTDSRAVAILCAVLTALEDDRLAASDLNAIYAGAQFIPPNKQDPVTSLLRFAFGLSKANASEVSLNAACDGGALEFLLTVATSAVFRRGADNWSEAYVHYAHNLATAFLEDPRPQGGIYQVKRMREAKHLGFSHLIRLLAALYEQGSPDLPQQCQALWPFVDYAVEEYLTEHSASTLMPLLQLLGSLADTQPQQVWSRLHSNALGMAWPGDLICNAMLSYCKTYAGDDFLSNLAQPRSLFQDENNMPVREVNIPNEDVDAILGYLKLLQQLMETAPGDFAIDRVRHLELRCFENQPIMFVLFTLLDLPVQPKLKAALFNVIGSFAGEMASAVKIWTFLENAAVRSKPAEAGFYASDAQDFSGSGPRTDILYELNEVEARTETYVETLAFITLVNRLLYLCEYANCGPAAGGGVASHHIFRFVRDAVFLKMDRRAYKSLTEKWQLTEACLLHFQLAIRLTQGTPPEFVVQGTSSPGQELLQDFENEGPVLRHILGLLHGGAGWLEEERNLLHGGALEVCIGQALSVLHTALPVKAASFSPQAPPRSNNFDGLLLRDRRRLAQLFSFVGYSLNPKTQALAVQVIHNLALRNERLSMMLDLATMKHLKKCVVDALEQGLQAAELLPGGTALVVCRLLVETLPQREQPNLAQLLLGFENDAEGGLTLSPLLHEACLESLLNAVRTPACADDTIGVLLLRESAFHVFYLLAADARTRGPAVALLRRELQLSAHVSDITVKRDLGPAEQTALLYQRAWLLRLAAVILHHVTEVDSAALDSGLLQALVASPSDAAGREAVPLLQLLNYAAALSFSPPPVLDVASTQWVDAFRLSDALSPSGAVEESELYSRNERGELTINLIALDALLRLRAAEQQCVAPPARAAACAWTDCYAFPLQVAARRWLLRRRASARAEAEQLARGAQRFIVSS